MAAVFGKTVGFLLALAAYTAFTLTFVSFLKWDLSWIDWEDVRVSTGISFLVMLWFRLKAGAQ